jgi:uncharacterized protein with PhoU and TrkA domain
MIYRTLFGLKALNQHIQHPSTWKGHSGRQTTIAISDYLIVRGELTEFEAIKKIVFDTPA